MWSTYYNLLYIAKQLAIDYEVNGFDLSAALFYTTLADMVTKGICISMVHMYRNFQRN